MDLTLRLSSFRASLHEGLWLVLDAERDSRYFGVDRHRLPLRVVPVMYLLTNYSEPNRWFELWL